MGDFFAERCLDELFLTLAPQVAGRDSSSERPGLVAGKRFAPEHPVWGTLVGVKRGESHLFLRYAFEDDTNRSTSAKARHHVPCTLDGLSDKRRRARRSNGRYHRAAAAAWI